MKRGGPLARRTPLKTGTRKPVTRRDTGPDQKTRGLVLARDNFQCVACGKTVGGAFTWWSIQHRVARGVGGGNELWNLIALCGSATSEGCHRKCEDRDREMQARGYWLESWQDPRVEPVMICDGPGSGASVWLTADGQYGAFPDAP